MSRTHTFAALALVLCVASSIAGTGAVPTAARRLITATTARTATRVRVSTGTLTVRDIGGGQLWSGALNVARDTELYKWVWEVLRQAVDADHVPVGTYALSSCDVCRHGISTLVADNVNGALELRRVSADPLQGHAAQDFNSAPAKTFFVARVIEHAALAATYPTPPATGNVADDTAPWGHVHVAHWGGGNVQPWQMSLYLRAAANVGLAQGPITQVQLWQRGHFGVAHTGFKLQGTVYYADGVYCAQGFTGLFKTFVNWYGGVGGVFDAAHAQHFTHAVIVDRAVGNGNSLTQAMLWREGLPFYSKELLYIPDAFGHAGDHDLLAAPTTWAPSVAVANNLVTLNAMANTPLSQLITWLTELQVEFANTANTRDRYVITELYLRAVSHVLARDPTVREVIRDLNAPGTAKADTHANFAVRYTDRFHTPVPAQFDILDGLTTPVGAYNSLFVSAILRGWPQRGGAAMARRQVAMWAQGLDGSGKRPFALTRTQLIGRLQNTGPLAANFRPTDEIARNA